jgi:hypothetical protein
MHAQIWSVILKTNVKSLSAIICVYLREINKASVVCRTLSRIEEDGRSWLRRPELCMKSCRTIIRKKKEV